MNYLPFIPVIGLLIGGVLFALLPLSRRKLLFLATIILLLLLTSLFGIPFQDLLAENYAWDGLSLYFSILILISTFFALLLGYRTESAGKFNYRKFAVLLWVLSATIILLSGAQNLLYFLVIWGIAQLLFFMLLSELDHKSAWNHLAIDLISTLIFLIGAGFLLALSGALNIVEIKTNLVVRFFTLAPAGKILTLALILITVGLVSKLGIFPFHFWLRNLHRQNSLMPYAIFSLLLRLGLLAFAIRFWLRSAAIYLEDWQYILFIGGTGSILWGGIALFIYRKENKGWLYLDLMQIGFLICGISAASYESLSGALFFGWGYFFSMWGLIFVFAYLNRPGFDFTSVLPQLKKNKIMLAVIIFLAASLIGFPITAGFWGKYNLLTALYGDRMWGLLIAGLMGTLLLIIYIALIFREKLIATSSEISQSQAWSLKVGLLLCAAALLAVGLFPELILDLVFRAAASIPF